MRLDPKFILQGKAEDCGDDWDERIGAVVGVVWDEQELLDDVAEVDDERGVERASWER